MAVSAVLVVVLAKRIRLPEAFLAGEIHLAI